MFGNLFSGFAGSLVSGLGSLFGANQTNQANREMVQQQEAFQTQMSNTAYQRATADMTAAGLNPMLMFGSGSAASTPPGATASMTSGFGDAGKALGQTVNNALSQSIMEKTIDKMTEEISKIKADTGLTTAATRTEEQRPGVEYEKRRVYHTEADTNIARGPQVGLASDLADILRGYYQSSAAQGLYKGGAAGHDLGRMLSPALDFLNSAGHAARTFRGSWADRVDRGFAN